MCMIWSSSRLPAWACNFVKKETLGKGFPVYFVKFQRTAFLTEHLPSQLLTLAINRILTNHTRTFITRHVHHFNVIYTNSRKVTNCIMLHFKHNLNKKHLNFLAIVVLLIKLSFSFPAIFSLIESYLGPSQTSSTECFCKISYGF